MKPHKEPILEKKLVILLIENSVELRAFFSGAIKKSLNFNVLTAGTANDARQILMDNYESINFILFNWISPNISGSIFAQNIRKNFKYDHIELITFSQNLSDEDSFLFSELDIHYTIPKIINGAQLIKKLEEIRSDYHLLNPVLKKLNELKHYVNIEDLENCEEIIKDEKILHKIQNNHKYLYIYGEILILRKDYDNAIKYFEDLLKDRSKLNGIETLKTMSTLGKAYCLAGRNKEALMIFEKLESKSPKNLNHKLMAGEALLGLNEHYKAESKFHEILEKNPKDKGALTGMVKSNSISGKYDVAKSFFHQIEGEFESKSLASYFNNRGVMLVKETKLSEAISFYKNALYFFKKYKGHISFNLGMAYYRSNKIEEAAEYFNETINSTDYELLSDKTLLKLFKTEGMDKFIENFKKLNIQKIDD